MGISLTQLLIVLVIIVMIFGTKRLRSLGTDLGDAIKNFRAAVKVGEEEKAEKALEHDQDNNSGAADAAPKRPDKQA